MHQTASVVILVLMLMMFAIKAITICRFADFELVARQDKPIRFYAGAPLVAAEGHKIGTL